MHTSKQRLTPHLHTLFGMGVLFIASFLPALGGCKAKPAITAPAPLPAPPPRMALDTQGWRGDIDHFLHRFSENAPPRHGVIFTGSSTIRMWDVDRYFPNRPVANTGFGGSTIPAVLAYMHLLTLPHEPEVIVFFCGSNDIAEGQRARFVVEDFKTFARRVHEALPQTHILFLGIAPTVERWEQWPQMAKANAAIQTFCDTDDRLIYVDQTSILLDDAGQPIPEMFADGLHMGDTGYAAVSQLIENELLALEPEHPSIAAVIPAPGSGSGSDALDGDAMEGDTGTLAPETSAASTESTDAAIQVVVETPAEAAPQAEANANATSSSASSSSSTPNPNPAQSP